MDQSLLTVSNLTVRINNQVILENFNFDVKKDETVAFIGPNGAGKTVLFRALLGIIPYQGIIKWQKNIKIGYVPQRLYVEPDLPMTTREFFGLKEGNRDKVAQALAAVGFEEDKPHEAHLEEHILKRKLGVLSGGELQRVLIAWAILGHPDVLLFDEPTAGVDVSAEESIYGLLHHLQEQEKMTTLLISHDLQVVYKYASKVVCVNKEQVCYGTPLTQLNQETLAKLYGANVGFYKHDHK